MRAYPVWSAILALVFVAGPSRAAEPSDATRRRLWLSGSLVQDVAYVPGAHDACSRDGQLDKDFACFREQGSQYHGTPLIGDHDRVHPSVAFGPTRALFGADYELIDRFTLGARLGWALRGGSPMPDGGHVFQPYQLELRAAYWFADHSDREPALAPFVLLAGGTTEIDTLHHVYVIEDSTAPPPPQQLDNPELQQLDVWKRTGVGFVAAGFGAYFSVGGCSGLIADAKLLLLFPSPGTAAQLSFGYAVGL